MTNTNFIAILVTDTPIPTLSDKYGDFGDQAIELLQLVGWNKSQFKKYQVLFEKDTDYTLPLENVYTELLKDIQDGLITGFLMTGSRSDSFATDIKWIERLDHFINTVLFKNTYPIFGICFGHQILCKNLGSKVGRNETNGPENGITTIQLNPDLINIESQLFDGIDTHINLVESHNDIVYNVPPVDTTLKNYNTSFINFGLTAKCAIQGIITEKGPLKIFTVQGHPEFSTEYTLDMLQYAFDVEKNITKHDFEKSVNNTKILKNQGQEVGQLITKFFQ